MDWAGQWRGQNRGKERGEKRKDGEFPFSSVLSALHAHADVSHYRDFKGVSGVQWCVFTVVFSP